VLVELTSIGGLVSVIKYDRYVGQVERLFVFAATTPAFPSPRTIARWEESPHAAEFIFFPVACVFSAVFDRINQRKSRKAA